MSGLIFPVPPKRQQRQWKRLLSTPPQGEVMGEVWDVYRIIGKHHMRVYVGYADKVTAQQNSDALQLKTGDKCYLVGRKNRRVTKRGTRN